MWSGDLKPLSWRPQAKGRPSKPTCYLPIQLLLNPSNCVITVCWDHGHTLMADPTRTCIQNACPIPPLCHVTLLAIFPWRMCTNCPALDDAFGAEQDIHSGCGAWIPVGISTGVVWPTYRCAQTRKPGKIVMLNHASLFKNIRT